MILRNHDTVNRDILFDRLRNLGIGGIFLNNLKALCQKTEYLITHKDGYLDPIDSNIGLEQGCPLSPIMFNLYIDDMKNIFDTTCEAMSIQDIKLNYIIYADDLLLMSYTKEGLQRSIDKLEIFAEKKHITISHEKSKTMIFNKTGRLIKESFKANYKELQSVRNFCYT